MPSVQEICRVDVTWLEAGEICNESDLGLTHPCPGHTFAVFHAPGNVYKPLAEEDWPEQVVRIDKAELIKAMWSTKVWDPAAQVDRPQVCLGDNYSADNPPVELLVPATIYTFDFPDCDQSWLAMLVSDEGIEGFVKDELEAVNNIGLYLWKHGQATDALRYNSRWGVNVSFYTLWTIQIGNGEDPDIDWHLNGWVDPKQVSATQLPLIGEKPERRPVLMHRLTNAL